MNDIVPLNKAAQARLKTEQSKSLYLKTRTSEIKKEILFSIDAYANAKLNSLQYNFSKSEIGPIQQEVIQWLTDEGFDVIPIDQLKSTFTISW